MRRVIRTIIDSVIEGAIKRVAAKGLLGESFVNREVFQHYGFTSRPLAGAEGLMIREGNVFYLIASDDRRFRIALQDGEVALYDDQGQAVHFKRGKQIHVYGADQLVADVGVETVVTCPLVRAVATTKVLLDTPLVQCTGNLLVAGGISSAGTYGTSGGKIVTPGDIESTAGEVKDRVRTLAADRQIYNGHTHPGDSGGTTGGPQ